MKHLRGKHDQRDHGRRAFGSAGGSLGGGKGPSLDSVADVVAKARETSEQNSKTTLSNSSTLTTRDRLDDVRNDIRAHRAALLTAQRSWKKAVKTGDDAARQKAEQDFAEAFGKAEGARTVYNSALANFQAARRAENRAQATSRRPPPTPPKPDTTTPFVSLESSGLKGWARQRPATPPDYTAFDQATRGEPDWMPILRSRIRSAFTRDLGLPRTFRDIDTTPEGMPVQMAIPDAPGASKMGDLSLDQVTPKDDDESPSFVRLEWEDGVFLLGEEIFANQNTDADAFWNQEISPATAWSTSGRRELATIGSTVGSYGEENFATINEFIRGGPDGERSVWSGIEDDIQTALRSPKSGSRAYDLELIQRQIASIQTTQSQISTMDAGMRPAPQTVMVRRGMGGDTFGRMQQHLKVGDRFTDDCFTSASINPVFNWSNSPMTNVILTEGTPVLWTDGHARGSRENEVIVGRGVTYEVVSTDNERGWILRTVPPDGPYTPPPVSVNGNDDPLSPQASQIMSSLD